MYSGPSLCMGHLQEEEGGGGSNHKKRTLDNPDMADEAGFLELLVANERIGRTLDVLCDPYQRSKHSHAIKQLQQDLERGASYIEEANRLGAVPILTKLLSTTSDEATLDVLSQIIALCSGPMACGGKVSSFTYGDLTVAVREGALGDGLGAKVWSVCHIMVREMLAYPEIFKGQQVLELGSGTGLVGLVAALAGAEQVVLTDHEDKVLLNLRTCMHMNAGPTHPAPSSAGHQHTAPHPAEQQQQQQDDDFVVPDDAELFDDAESVDDFDLGELVSGTGAAAGAASSTQTAGAHRGDAAAEGSGNATNGHSNGVSCRGDDPEQQAAWDAANMCVRLLDWQESQDALLLEEQKQQQQQGEQREQELPPQQQLLLQQQQPPQQQQQDAPQHPTSSASAPHVTLSQRFPVILGNEVMYEKAHARLVAAAIRHRLQAGGRALLCCAVRDQAVFDAFRDTCSRWGLRYRAVRVEPQSSDELGGIAGRERDYEGGYLLMAVDHAAAPAQDWHRDDFSLVC